MTLEWFIRKVKETKDKEDLLKFLSWVEIGGEGLILAIQEVRPPRFWKECGGTAAWHDQICRRKPLPSYDKLAKLLDLPLDEFETGIPQGESTRQAGNPVYKLFIPALSKSHQSHVRADVRRAMFFGRHCRSA